MNRIAHLHPAPTDVEIAILKMSAAEHEQLHQNPLKFVNDNQVFPKPVTKVDLSAHPQSTSATWLSLVVHYPHCTCSAACVPAEG